MSNKFNTLSDEMEAMDAVIGTPEFNSSEGQAHFERVFVAKSLQNYRETYVKNNEDLQAALATSGNFSADTNINYSGGDAISNLDQSTNTSNTLNITSDGTKSIVEGAMTAAQQSKGNPLSIAGRGLAKLGLGAVALYGMGMGGAGFAAAYNLTGGERVKQIIFQGG